MVYWGVGWGGGALLCIPERRLNITQCYFRTFVYVGTHGPSRNIYSARREVRDIRHFSEIFCCFPTGVISPDEFDVNA